MFKKSTQLYFAVVLFFFALLTTTAFINKARDIAIGGGIAGGHRFNFSAVENSSKISGHFSWDDTDFEIIAVQLRGQTATLWLSGGMAVNVVEEKNTKAITAPFAATNNLGLAMTETMPALTVVAGNLSIQ